MTQISIMKMVKHDNVVKLYEVLASRTKVGRLVCPAACASGRLSYHLHHRPCPLQIFIVLELITGGELFDKIVAEGR